MPRPPNLAADKFQERPSGASKMQESFTAAGAPPWIPLGEHAAFRSPRPLSWLPLPKNHTLPLGTLVLGLPPWLLTRYEVWPLPQHDGLDPPTAAQYENMP